MHASPKRESSGPESEAQIPGRSSPSYEPFETVDNRWEVRKMRRRNRSRFKGYYESRHRFEDEIKPVIRREVDPNELGLDQLIRGEFP